MLNVESWIIWTTAATHLRDKYSLEQLLANVSKSLEALIWNLTQQLQK